MKVVLDTNVLVSALFFKGKVGCFLELIDVGKIIPCFTQSTTNELREVLGREKFQKEIVLWGETVENIVDALLEKSLIHPDPIEKAVMASRDPDDNMFLDCALAAKADYIVSGDKDLLVLEEFHAIPIVTPAKFLQKIK